MPRAANAAAANPACPSAYPTPKGRTSVATIHIATISAIAGGSHDPSGRGPRLQTRTFACEKRVRPVTSS